jgi:hypothetical protein
VAVQYDKPTDQLIVTVSYRGTNPNHVFSTKWGACRPNQAGGLPGVTVEVLDDQFKDEARESYKKTTRFSLEGMPCGRPATITLRTAPRFLYTLTIPG